MIDRAVRSAVTTFRTLAQKSLIRERVPNRNPQHAAQGKPNGCQHDQETAAENREAGSGNVQRHGDVQQIARSHLIHPARENDRCGDREQPAQECDDTAFQQENCADRARSGAERAHHSDLARPFEDIETDRCAEADRAHQRCGQGDHPHDVANDGEMFLERFPEFSAGLNVSGREMRIEQRLIERGRDRLLRVRRCLDAQQRRNVAQRGNGFEGRVGRVERRGPDFLHDPDDADLHAPLAKMQLDFAAKAQAGNRVLHQSVNDDGVRFTGRRETSFLYRQPEKARVRRITEENEPLRLAASRICQR